MYIIYIYISVVLTDAGRFGDALKKHEKLLRFVRSRDFFHPTQGRGLRAYDICLCNIIVARTTYISRY